MNTLVINGTLNWQQYCGGFLSQESPYPLCIKFQDLNETMTHDAIDILANMPKLLASVRKIEVHNCRFDKSSESLFAKMIKPSVTSLSIKKSILNGRLICNNLQKLSTLQELSFVNLDLRGAQKELRNLLLTSKATISFKMDERVVNETFCSEIFDVLKNCTSLKSLEIDGFFDLDKNVASAIADNDSLTRLLIRVSYGEFTLADLAKANPKTNLLELHLQGFTLLDNSTMLEKIGEYSNLTKLVLKFQYSPNRAGQLAGSIEKLTKLQTLNIRQIRSLGEPMMNMLALNRTITDLTCTRTQYCTVVEKCQSVNKSVTFKSLSFGRLPAGNYAVEPDIFADVLQLNGLTKLKLHMIDFNVDNFIAGLNSVNCKVTNLEIADSCKADDINSLLTALKKNSTLKRLSLKNRDLDAAGSALCKLIRANQSLRSISMFDPRSEYSILIACGDIVDALKVNKTLLYLDMQEEYLQFADRVVNELIPANSTLQHFSPVSSDYRVDMWLQRNRQQRGAVEIVLQNIVRAGSVLPTEIWLKIFDYV